VGQLKTDIKMIFLVLVM